MSKMSNRIVFLGLTLCAVLVFLVAPGVAADGDSYASGITVGKNPIGRITLDNDKPEPGDTVTVTITMEEGYQIRFLQIYNDGGDMPYTDNADGTYSFTVVTGFEKIVASFDPINNDWSPFVDIEPDAWYRGCIKYVWENNLMQGTSATTFEPDIEISRGMMVTVLWRMAGEPAAMAESNFRDLTEDWYKQAIDWAASYGITQGNGDGTFRPNDTLRRDQMATFFYRYADYKGYDIAAVSGSGRHFQDYDRILPYAIPGMEWAYYKKLMYGRTDKSLCPDGYTFRGELAEVLVRFIGTFE